MQNKASLFILGVGLPLAYYFYRDVAYDLTADIIGDKSRKQRKLAEMEAEKQKILSQNQQIPTTPAVQNQENSQNENFSGLPNVTGHQNPKE